MAKKRRRSVNVNWKALGLELMVVFLGVTAGFLLNNWRAGMQEKGLEQKYIAGFLQDIDADIKELEESIERDSTWLVRADPLMEILSDGNITTDSARVIMNIVDNIYKINSHTGTYEDISSSGNLNLISDFDLRSLIVDYYIAIRDIEYIDDVSNNFFGDFVVPFLVTEHNLMTNEFVDEKVIYTPRFTNMFVGHYSMTRQRKNVYKDILEKCYLLREELKKKQ